MRKSWPLAALVVASISCGSDSGSGSSPTDSGTYTPGQFPAASSVANQCAAPRSGSSPVTGRAYPDRAGSTTLENTWLRSWTHDLYLWYAEVPDLNPASYASTADYFPLLKTAATTPSGNPKDKFHFTYSTADWEALSQTGVSAGYGLQWAVVASRPPRSILVAYTEPNSPATQAKLVRGAKVLTVDGVDAVNAPDQASVDKLNNGLFPPVAGGMHTFTVLDPGSSSPRSLSMTAADIKETPVQNVKTIDQPGGPVGYILFNDHIATAESELIAAFEKLKGAKVKDLVLDIRYNGGGYLDIASEVGYMIAGAGATSGKTFEETVFNDQHKTVDPVTGEAIAPVPFHSTSQGFSGPANVALPTLNLSRVYVLTSGGTCSASESIINSLRGIDVDVIAVGLTTCGKPYGFYPADNCGTTYFSIQFRGENAKGFGDYPDGFSPNNTANQPGVKIQGCSVNDDFSHALGDPNERRLAAALGYRLDGKCPAAAGLEAPAAALDLSSVAVDTPKNIWRENRILRR